MLAESPAHTETCNWRSSSGRCNAIGTPREPTGLPYCEYHWKAVLGLRNNLQAYGEAKQMGLAVRIEQFFLWTPDLKLSRTLAR